MEESSNAWNIFTAAYMVIGTVAIVKVIIDLMANWNTDNDFYKPTLPDPIGVTFEEEMYRQGYIFCTCFKTSDIHVIARKMGLVITKMEAIRVVSEIKKDFTIAVGIDKHRIEMYIRIILKRNQQNQ
jgi:hypothetical protein